MKTDVAIIGGGPAGTATALFLAKAGIRSTIVEKDVFPRFHIGESMTGECGKAIRQLGLGDEMQSRNYFVKRGVNVYTQEGKDAFQVPVMRRTEAGLESSSTWHVKRSTFDKMMLDTALERGATWLPGRAIAPLRTDKGKIRGLSVQTESNGIQDVAAKIVVDASGPATFLSNAGIAGVKERGHYSNQVAIFSHVVGADRDGAARDQTLIFYKKLNHWGWFIPIDDEVVSVGIVVPASYFASRKESKHDFFVRESQELNPRLTERLANSRTIGDVRAASNYSYEIKQFAGDGYVCVGDSHRFIDPIFSFGLHFAVMEGRMAANAIAEHLNRPHCLEPFNHYQNRAASGQNVIQTLIDAFWNHPLAFGFLAHMRHREELIDLFAGRVYLDEATPGLLAMQKLNGTVN